MSHVVVIGAGQAGCALTAKLRNAGFDGKITLIGEEPVPPYQRPPLSKAYLLGEMEEERLYLRPLEFYAENAIDLRMGAAVEAVDVAAKTVSVGGEVIGYFPSPWWRCQTAFCNASPARRPRILCVRCMRGKASISARAWAWSACWATAPSPERF